MNLLEFDHVTHTFPPIAAADAGGAAGARTILDQVDLALGEREVVALVGRSGVGKTTLLYLAAGLDRPTAGRILFAGDDLARLRPARLSRLRRRQIGLVFQNNLSLNALPVWENAALPLLLEGTRPAVARRQAEQMLERVGLAPFAHTATATLSGGQRRRLGLARAMVGQPRLLLADEPTADLDDETSAEIERLLFGWLAAERRAALIVTHSPTLARAAHRVLTLDGGHLVERPPMADPAAATGES